MDSALASPSGAQTFPSCPGTWVSRGSGMMCLCPNGSYASGYPVTVCPSSPQRNYAPSRNYPQPRPDPEALRKAEEAARRAQEQELARQRALFEQAQKQRQAELQAALEARDAEVLRRQQTLQMALERDSQILNAAFANNSVQPLPQKDSASLISRIGTPAGAPKGSNLSWSQQTKTPTTVAVIAATTTPSSPDTKLKLNPNLKDVVRLSPPAAPAQEPQSPRDPPLKLPNHTFAAPNIPPPITTLDSNTAKRVLPYAVIGASIGSALDEQDRRQLAAMTRATATSGKNRRYRNSKTGVTLTTRTAGIVGDCRTVEQEVVMADGTRRVDSVQACRTQKGWKFGA